MTIGDHLTTFAGRPVYEYDADEGIEPGAARISLEYDDWSAGVRIEQRVQELREDPKAHELEALVIGAWDFESSSGPEKFIAELCSPESVAAFKSLKALFVGDIVMEEQEISWINQGDLGPILRAYPNLETLHVRGGTGLSFSWLESETLTELVIESGGLPSTVIDAINGSFLPKLQRLELWLGSENYGGDSSVDTLSLIMSGRAFPHLKYLGLRDSEYTDDIARAIAHAPVLTRLHELDLSMGTLGDVGAEALLASPLIAKLQSLNLSHHYISVPVQKRFEALSGVKVNLAQAQNPDEERYISVSE